MADLYTLYNKPQDKFALNFIGKSSIIEKDNTVFYVRPEMIKLKDDMDSNAIIDKKIFKGLTIEYEVLLDTDQRLVSMRLNTQKDFEIRQRVYADFKYEKIK